MFTKWRLPSPSSRLRQWSAPQIQKWGTKNPIALVVTDTNVSSWLCDVNADGTLKTNFVGAPVLLTTGTGTTATIGGNRTGALADTVGTPSPPLTRTATFFNDGTMSIASWGGGPTASGGALVGRWVRIPTANPAGTGLAVATYTVASVSGTHFTVKDSNGVVQTWGAGGTASMGTASVTTYEEMEGAEMYPAAATAFQSLEADRDYIIILPGDLWGINPQRATGLDKPYGLYINGGNNVLIYSGEISLNTDWLKAAGGIGINRKQATPFTADSGGGYYDEVQRGLRIRDHRGTLHIEGVKIGGRYLWECIDYSNFQVTGTVVSSAITAKPIRQVQRCMFGDAVNPVRNQQIQNISSQASMLSQTGTQVGDIWNNTATGHAWLYNGGDRSSIASYTDLGAGSVPVQHSGGDCQQDWGISGGSVHRIADCTYYTTFQALFLAWNDQPPSNFSTAGGPASYDIRRVRIHSYTSGPWLVYVTKGGQGNSPVPTRLEDVWITLHGYTVNSISKLTSFNGRALAATGTDSISEWADGTSSTDADLVVSGPAKSVRFATARYPVNARTKGGDYATDDRTGRNYRPGAWW